MHTFGKWEETFDLSWTTKYCISILQWMLAWSMSIFIAENWHSPLLCCFFFMNPISHIPKAASIRAVGSLGMRLTWWALWAHYIMFWGHAPPGNLGILGVLRCFLHEVDIGTTKHSYKIMMHTWHCINMLPCIARSSEVRVQVFLGSQTHPGCGETKRDNSNKPENWIM